MRTSKPRWLPPLSTVVSVCLFDMIGRSVSAFHPVTFSRMHVAAGWTSHHITVSPLPETSPIRLQVFHTRDADFVEMMMGGERYEMIPLPDSMMATTLIVRGFGDFVNDGDLSELFRAVSKLNSVPACVVRKPNFDSLGYGFVMFPTEEEKEAAIIRFHGTEMNGRRIKVEEIRDDKSGKRVRVPEKMVTYACGETKKTRNGQTNVMRRVLRYEQTQRQHHKHKNKLKKEASNRSPRLNVKEQAEMNRAIRRGYVTLDGTGYRRGRKGSALATTHRQFCDKRAKPHIILFKASWGRPLDNIVVDLSPLRINSLSDDPKIVDDFLLKWKVEILVAADGAGMDLREDYAEDNTITLGNVGDCRTEYIITFDSDESSPQPIWCLPSVSMGVFEGDRSKAKQMANELAELWDIPEELAVCDDDADFGARSNNHRDKVWGSRGGAYGRTKMKGPSRNRKNRRNKEICW